MSDRILRAFMQLFAIVANTDEVGQNGRILVERFLKWQLPRQLVNHYLDVYDNFLFLLKERVEEGKVRKRTSVNSVKVLRICSEINKELEQRQKIIVLIRLYEFIHSAAGVFSEQHLEFLNTVADIFSIQESDRENCRAMATGDRLEERIPTGRFHMPQDGRDKAYFLPAGLCVLTFDDPPLMLIRYTGEEQLMLDGREIIPGIVMVCEPGSVIRGPRITPVYYNDIISSRASSHKTVVYEVEELSYNFSKGKTALHPLSFSAGSGQLIGIMGNSGAGKTTLLNLLNGSLKPTSGTIRINGNQQDIAKGGTEAIIGNVPQDDLLIEELTVFQNLFYSSKLYFGNLGDHEITAKVDVCLDQLQLSGVRDLKVGDPLNKFISGGQRKRLNIALELIREPEVLFVDEPTSGLSSSDSENVMDLLKQQALAGRLVFVVIHQPSSEIYKMFDELLVLDTGGYSAYYGNPVDALHYFRKQMNYVNYENSECPECGHINPEELFNIINAKTVDEFGKPTSSRKVSPEEWHRLFLQQKARSNEQAAEVSHDERKSIPIAGKLRQYLVYFRRNIMAKLQNAQYIGITLAEAPILAFVLAFTLRSTEGDTYLFGENPNIPAYLFISTIVALFLGLITSAEEIIQDRKILRRESYLKLSRQSYLLSKISYLFCISALQTGLFVLIGHGILDYPGSYLPDFLVLFSVSCLGNLLGLNISSALRTRVAVYILIPFLVIPQIMFSGVLVRFDELNTSVTSPYRVPLVGNIMATRWAFEAIITRQYAENEYERHYFKTDQALNNTIYRKDTWLPLMKEKIQEAEKDDNLNQLLLLEFHKAEAEFPGFAAPFPIEDPKLRTGTAKMVVNLDSMKSYLLNRYNELIAAKEQITENLITAQGGIEAIALLKKRSRNDQLSDIVLNTNSFKPKAAFTNDGIVRRFRPVYADARSSNFLDVPFYAAEKPVFSKTWPTLIANSIILWGMCLFLYLLLSFDILNRLLERKLFRLSLK